MQKNITRYLIQKANKEYEVYERFNEAYSAFHSLRKSEKSAKIELVEQSVELIPILDNPLDEFFPLVLHSQVIASNSSKINPKT